MKYEKDINCAEFIDEITDFQHVVKSIIPDHIKSATVIELLQLIQDYNLKESYPNIEIVFRIFLTMPVTAATCERSFSKLKLIKNYLTSTMGQERLSNLSILSIENEVAGEINFEDVIDEFAAIKSRKYAPPAIVPQDSIQIAPQIFVPVTPASGSNTSTDISLYDDDICMTVMNEYENEEG
ncbi:hypothetical protein QTP88_013097 [Uroleucon formosanum]